MATRIPTMYGRYYVISFIWRGRQMTFTAYRASLSKMQRPQAQKLCDKMYPGCRVISFHESDATDGPVVLTTESKSCGEGMYYCNDDQKCKPIPKGYKEREDGYLVKEAASPAQQAAIAISMKKKGIKPKNETYFYAGETPSVHKDKDQKKKENEKKVKKEDTVVLTKAADEKKKKKKEKAVQGATDVPNFPQDQVSEDWQKKSGKSDSGGLNEKGRKSYERQNPGSDLKAPVTGKVKKGGKAAKRRKSFCSRMRGMKKKLTSAKTARDPDSRINKSLRKWNC
jgi:hypothetical protein